MCTARRIPRLLRRRLVGVSCAASGSLRPTRRATQWPAIEARREGRPARRFLPAYGVAAGLDAHARRGRGPPRCRRRRRARRCKIERETRSQAASAGNFARQRAGLSNLAVAGRSSASRRKRCRSAPFHRGRSLWSRARRPPLSKQVW
ncbi:hypothetical protein GQ55_8G233600 [Panicum hallii var. hallii]|uniref:Uncharacterized protein n=1 Tax=Panicum hallii var. hallii TaxID=1504633 RepID=A0A2T7CQL2_9POAL|nr:hypothetical protein GQ55_8G233600 [Panicum hallii var. hallii]